MPLLAKWLGQPARRRGRRPIPLAVERLEDRTSPDVSGVLTGGTLFITASPRAIDNVMLSLDSATGQLVLRDFGVEVGRFASAAVANIAVNALGRHDIIRIDPAVPQPATITGGSGNYLFFAGGGPTTLIGGAGENRLSGGPANDVLQGTTGTDTFAGGGGKNTLIGGTGHERFLGFRDRDTIVNFDPVRDRDLRCNVTPPDLSDFLGLTPSPNVTITSAEVGQLLQRAAAATASDDAIVAVVDRGGRVLGVRVEGNVSPSITGNVGNLVFAIDGALAEARTGAFFGNNQAPLTSRTIQFISQTTITQREVESNPSIADPNSTLRGPGFVAPIGIHGHFPPEIPFTPQVDLFQIEGTNRDTTVNPYTGAVLTDRFNINPAFIPARIPLNQRLAAPDSYGFITGTEPNAQPRGIGTLPGGIPIVKNGVVVGGIGVFFPGKTGFADEENSALQSNFDPSKPDRSLEAEYVAFAALGGSSGAGFPIGTLGGVAPLPGFDLPFGRIDLVGITLPLFGPGGLQGPENLVRFGQTLGIGNPGSGVNEPVDPNPAITLKDGTPVPEGFLVEPHDGVGITAAQVRQIIEQGVAQAQQTRAAIRLPLDSLTRMVFAVTDKTGEVLGLFRMPDATVFSIDVAVAKARNVAYYADPTALQPIDQTPGVPPGVAFTNRTFRYLALPRFPEGQDGYPPGPFSILNDGGTDLNTGLNAGPPLPASAFQSVQGHDAFNPQTNFHDPFNPNNQNGIVFFPGSSPLYVNGGLVGGFGVSGDGVDQDDVVTFAGKQGFDVPDGVLRADQEFVRNVRLPYQKFNRQPLEP
jgi:uncharacterized protein GlcG (DUF336 family)